MNRKLSLKCEWTASFGRLFPFPDISGVCKNREGISLNRNESIIFVNFNPAKVQAGLRLESRHSKLADTE